MSNINKAVFFVLSWLAVVVGSSAYAATGYVMSLRNTQLDAITTAVGNAGKVDIYDGVRPSTCGVATTKLASFTMGSPFAPAAASAVLSPTLPSATTGITNGTATWFRITTSGGTCVIDGSAGTSLADLILSSTSITTGGSVSLTSITITRGNA